MRHREPPIRRPSSSAETSIDEDTADQLLADDFSVPASPISSRPGATVYARPTSSAFEPHRPRTSSVASSQIPQSPHRTQSDASLPPPRSPILEPAFILPSAAPVSPPVSPIVRPDSAVESFGSAYANPFVDPIEPVLTSEISEKPTVAWPEAKKEQQLAPPEAKDRKPRKRLIIFILLAVIIVLAIVLIPVGLLVIKSKGSSSTDDDVEPPRTTDAAALGIPPSADGTVLDSTRWLDWTDFNVTYTNATVGGLSVMVYLLPPLRLNLSRA